MSTQIGTAGGSAGATGVATVTTKPKKERAKRSYIVLRKDGSGLWEELNQAFVAATVEEALEQAGELLNSTGGIPEKTKLVAIAAKYFQPKPIGVEVTERIKIG